MTRLIDLTGKKFGKLTVLSREESYRKIPRWVCGCECGNTKVIRGAELRYRKTKTCGCRDLCKENNPFYKHGMTGSKFWVKWRSMKQRCLDKNSSGYHKYGARGVGVCDRWISFENFKEDMYQSYEKHVKEYGEKDTTLDRVNAKGNYEPGNCRWATNLIQGRNRTNNRYLTYNGKTMTMTEWGKEVNIDESVIERRLNLLKWSTEDALTRPLRKMKKRNQS